MKTLLLFLLISAQSFGQQGLGTLRGTVKDQNGEFLPFARILVYADSTSIVGGAEADFDGDFQINSIVTGIYTVKIKDLGVEMNLDNVEVFLEKITNLGEITLTIPEFYGGCLCTPSYPTLILDPLAPITIESKDIRRL